MIYLKAFVIEFFLIGVHYSLRRRFEQNQEDCTFTVLAILPTATENILDAIPVEQILDELQKHKAERLARSVGPSEVASSAPPSVTDDDAKSLTSFQSESYVHASQIANRDGGNGEGSEATVEKKPKKSKAQLWNDMKISCKYSSLLYEGSANLSQQSLEHSHYFIR